MKEIGELYRKLNEYAKSDYYPYHMPGHKRTDINPVIAPVAGIDITEIDGFDNLHDASGILKKIQEKAAEAYGAEESFYLVNGSTSGVLSAISAAVPAGRKILMVRNAHKSAYHAAYLRNLETEYLWPEIHPEFGCPLPATAKQVEEALLQENEIKAVFIVSPTYEGLVADVRQIAEVVHRHGIPLIVDEAHGAHLGFHPAFAENSCQAGADLVIQSLHKTLPSLTQTAILHVKGSLIDRQKLHRFTGIYQTSSPSYIFMAEMEETIGRMAVDGYELLDKFRERWTDMMAVLNTCRHLRFLQETNSDIGKLVIMDASGKFDGGGLYRILLEKYHLQMEMAAGDYVLAMFTLADPEEGYRRMVDALLEIDRSLSGVDQKRVPITEIPKPIKAYDLADAWDQEKMPITLEQAAGKTAGEFINLYPPGSPIIVPGERFTEEITTKIQEYTHAGLTVQGIEQPAEGQITVTILKEK